MFFKNLKNKFLLLTFITTLIIPSSAFAYSDYIIAGGENIGIELNSKGILVVGTYEVNGKNPAKEANLQNGDKIVKINEKEVSNIEEMLNVIESSTNKESLLLTYIRGEKEHNTTLNLQKSDNNIYKTGLYVKDSITGVGTLTFIDPNTKLFGALGHEIIEKNTGQKLEIKDGKIYSSTVTSITRSDNGRPGEKNAKYDSNMVFGSVFENTSQGIFGNYTNSIPQKKLYQVGTVDKITTGDAKILTVIEEENVEEFTINILKVNGNLNSSKNILFEVTDNKLLKNTGGIVQGMSGSPIIQNDYIIGAVTHVVVDDPTKGYGILITKMLEEAEN
ncbi:MAG: SpoIVB peptidase [Bacilli bacterium]